MAPGQRNPNRRSLAERLAKLVDASGGPKACWPFKGYVAADEKRGLPGYGQIRDEPKEGETRGRLLKAHRAALILKTGGDRPGEDACHKCDNTICCNPDHLFWGSHRYNMMDYVRKYGRLGVSKTERPAPPRPQLPFEADDEDAAFIAALARKLSGEGPLYDDEVPFAWLMPLLVPLASAAFVGGLLA